MLFKQLRETSRTLYSRQKEHFTGLAAKKENNAIYKLKELHHISEKPKLFSKEKNSLQNQCQNKYLKAAPSTTLRQVLGS